jgi:hypothetical protein
VASATGFSFPLPAALAEAASGQEVEVSGANGKACDGRRLRSSVTAAAAMKTAATAAVKAAAGASRAAGRTAEAGRAAGPIGIRGTTMVGAVEGTGMTGEGHAAGAVRYAARESAGMSEVRMVVRESGTADSPMSEIEMIVIAKVAVVMIGVVVVYHLAAVPVGAPVVPPPAKAAVSPDAYPHAERDPRPE